MEIVFPGGTQLSWKITQISVAREYDKHSLEWKFQEGGGPKQKWHPWGVWIFFLDLHNVLKLLLFVCLFGSITKH